MFFIRLKPQFKSSSSSSGGAGGGNNPASDAQLSSLQYSSSLRYNNNPAEQQQFSQKEQKHRGFRRRSVSTSALLPATNDGVINNAPQIVLPDVLLDVNQQQQQQQQPQLLVNSTPVLTANMPSSMDPKSDLNGEALKPPPTSAAAYGGMTLAIPGTGDADTHELLTMPRNVNTLHVMNSTGLGGDNEMLPISRRASAASGRNNHTASHGAGSSRGSTSSHTRRRLSLLNDPNLPERGTWSKKIDFLMSCIGYAVGLGNMWRFPYLCYKNGGGAFLVPYFIALLGAGIPMFFMETAVGQWLNVGGLGVFRVCPAFKGVGIAAAVAAFWLNIQYIIVLAWALYYLFSSFATKLPWADCSNSWNTPFCRSSFEPFNCTEYLTNIDVHDNISRLYDLPFETPCDEVQRMVSEKSVTPVKEFWERKALERTSGIHDLGGMRWELVGTLFLAWSLVYFSIFKGVQWTGKVVYFTAVFPYVLLIVLLIRGVTLPGAMVGIRYYLTPNLEKLGDYGVWMDATTQIFFSYGLALGALTALGSYNQYHNNVYRDALIVSCFNSGTSFLAGFVVFSTLGFLAHTQNKDISQVADQGPGLAFQAYPNAILQLPYSPFWSILFFLKIVFLGLDSQFCTVEGFITALVDEYPRLLRRHRELFILAVCIVSYLLGLICVSQGGLYVFELLNYYAASGPALLYLVFFECIAFSWSYGVNRLFDNIRDMIGYYPSVWWKITWVFITPAICLSVFIYSAIRFRPLSMTGYTYPTWSTAVGFLIASSSMICIPGYMIYIWFRTTGTIRERCKKLFRPDFEVEDFRRHDKFETAEARLARTTADDASAAASLTVVNTSNNKRQQALA